MNKNNEEVLINGDETIDIKEDLQKKIAAAVWLKAIGQISEAILLSKLYSFSEESESAGEITVVAGYWIQAIGQFLAALGVTKEISTDSVELIIESQHEAIIGELLHGVGGIISAIGGTEILYEDTSRKTDFIP